MRAVSASVFVSLLGALAACAPEGSSAYVSFNVPPDGNCEVSPTTDKFIPIGLFDIGAVNAKTDYCKKSYVMNLLVDSNLKANARDSTGRAEPNVLQISGAVLRLMDKNEKVLSFRDKNNDPDASRPNPFRVRTGNSLSPATGRDPSRGVVSFEAIPASYAEKLTDYDGDKILVEVQIEGTTTGDVDIQFRPWVYPVSICRGCLSMCRSDLPDGTTPDDVYGKQCPDNGAQDGRFCIDPGC